MSERTTISIKALDALNEGIRYRHEEAERIRGEIAELKRQRKELWMLLDHRIGGVPASETKGDKRMDQTEKAMTRDEALVVLKDLGWRPLFAIGGVPTVGLMPPPGGFAAYTPEELEAVACLKGLGWETGWDAQMNRLGYRSCVLAPLDRSFESLFATKGAQ